MPESEHILISYATVMVMCILAIAIVFLIVGMRLSTALQAFVESQVTRSRTEEKMVSIFQEFLEEQRRTHEQIWMGIQVQADRLNRFLHRPPGPGAELP